MQTAYEEKLVTYTPVENRLSNRSFIARYIIAALLYIVFFSGIAYLSGGIRSFGGEISWGRTFIPDSLIKDVSLGHMSNEERFLAAVMSMDANFPYLGDSRTKPIATVPVDQEIIVIGRYGFADKSSYVLATMTGSFNQTCTIQANGIITGIAHSNDTALSSYSPPPGGKTGIGTCNGNEIFFMPWHHA